jgi:hypothetical protein
MLVSICDLQKQTCDDATDVARDLATLACSADASVVQLLYNKVVKTKLALLASVLPVVG